MISSFEFRLKTIEADDYFQNEWKYEYLNENQDNLIDSNNAVLMVSSVRNYDDEELESLVSGISSEDFEEIEETSKFKENVTEKYQKDSLEIEIIDDKADFDEEAEYIIDESINSDPLEYLEQDNIKIESSIRKYKVENDDEMMSEKYYVSTTLDQKLPFVCEICGIRFPEEKFALFHVRRLHEDVIKATESEENINVSSPKKLFQDEFIAVALKKEIESDVDLLRTLKYKDSGIKDEQLNDDNDFRDENDPDYIIEDNEENELNKEGDKDESSKNRAYRKLPKIPDNELPIQIENGFRCAICEKIFVNRNQAMNHLRRTHKGMRYNRKKMDVEKLCNICGAKFQHPTNYYEHYKRHFPENCPKCSFCGKIFANRFQCTLHERSHTGEKPFKCELCTYTCSQKSSLKVRIIE